MSHSGNIYNFESFLFTDFIVILMNTRRTENYYREKCKKGVNAQCASNIVEALMIAREPSCLWKNARDRLKIHVLSVNYGGKHNI